MLRSQMTKGRYEGLEEALLSTIGSSIFRNLNIRAVKEVALFLGYPVELQNCHDFVILTVFVSCSNCVC